MSSEWFNITEPSLDTPLKVKQSVQRDSTGLLVRCHVWPNVDTVRMLNGDPGIRAGDQEGSMHLHYPEQKGKHPAYLASPLKM